MNMFELVTAGAPDAIAITAPNRPSLDYAGLRAQIERTGAALAGLGLTSKDRVAIILPNGPEMAVSFVSVASYMSAAPLNPNYKKAEYLFYLEDLKPKLVIVAQDSDNPVVEAAKDLNITVVEARVDDDMAAGCFHLTDLHGEMSPAGSDNEALVLHTSGTTSRPKVVPLLQRNIIASANNISSSLELSADDHCLNIMPLFHIHGLIAVLCASLSKGASICCSSGFNAIGFLELAKSEQISW